MLRSLFGVLTATLLVMSSPQQATADDFELSTFSVKGVGTFAPVNLGVERSRGKGVVLGDGTGLSFYTDAEYVPEEYQEALAGVKAPEGVDFRLNGVLQPPMDDGFTDRHHGTPQTYGKGRARGDKVIWNYVTGLNPKYPELGNVHVMETARGQVHFWYFGPFILTGDAEIGSTVVGTPLFFIVGGTGDFEGATGVVQVRVQNPDPLPFPPEVLPSLPPPLAVPFDYDFFGFIVLPGDDS